MKEAGLAGGWHMRYFFVNGAYRRGQPALLRADRPSALPRLSMP
jgi:hypothetical protein